MIQFKQSASAVAEINPANKEKKVLVPLTTSLYVPGKLTDVENVLVDIGTGYYVKKTTQEADKHYKSKVDYVNKNLETLQQTLEKKQDKLHPRLNQHKMKFSSFLALAATVAGISAHGVPQSFTINGQGYPAYDPQVDPWQPHAPKVNRPISDDGPLYSKDDPMLTCNKVGTQTPAEMTADAAPGSPFIIQWDRWPSDHKGPVLTYAKFCGPGHDDCNNVQDIVNGWFKIDEAGYDANTGQWASDQLVAQGASWTLNLPPAENIQQGSYLIRHEIIALHSQGAPQFYPHCIQVYINGGTGSLQGQSVSIPGNVYSNAGDDGTLFGSIYSADVSSMSIPGPTLANASSNQTTTSLMTKLCVNFDTAPLAIGETILNGISPNGQIAVAHRRRIDILTANTGVYLNQDQAKALWKPRSRSIVEDAARNTSPGGALSAIVEPTTDTYLWNGWKSTTWSPAGLTSYGGCLLAVLTTNCDLFIVAPKVNFFIGKWLPTFDASARLREENAALLESSDPNEQLKGALRSQVLSIAWSTNPSTHQDVVAPSDISILVTGTKSGELLIWKHLQHGQMDLVMCIDGHSKSWISLIALSDWRKQDNGYVLDIYYTSTDYDIYKTTITHTNGLHAISEQPHMINSSNGQTVTSFKYIDDILIWTTPGSLFFLPPDGTVKEVDIKNLTMVVGLDRVSPSLLVLWFTDGGIKFVDLDNSSVVEDLSVQATRRQRDVFVETAKNVFKKGLGKMHAPFVYSARKIPNTNTYIWLFHVYSPEDIEYIEESQQQSVLSIVDTLLPQEKEETEVASLIAEINNNILNPTDIWTSSISSTQHVMERTRSILQSDSKDTLVQHLEAYFSSFADTYRNLILGNYNPSAYKQADTSGNLVDKVTDMFSCDLWTMPSFDVIRRACLISTYLNNVLDTEHDFKRRELESIIVVAQLYVICQRLLDLAKMQILLDDSQPVIARLVHAGLYLRSSPPELQRLAGEVAQCFAGMGSDAIGCDGEKCPASGTNIHFDHLQKAKSDLGIEWPRCAITLSILSDVHVKRSTSARAIYKDLTFSNEHVDLVSMALSLSARKCIFTNAPFVRINDVN
ncbi:hypothetical protein E3Q13_01215 [Wallemia mellicola]|nr:hypothetical protein E3Q13_01215 [Wallemia mellicola]